MPAHACAKRIKNIKNTATASSIKTFKIMPITLKTLPLPARFALEIPTIQRVSETSAVIEVKIRSVDAFSAISSATLTTIFKRVKRKPIAAQVLDFFVTSLFRCTLSLAILLVFGKVWFLCKKIKAFVRTPFIFLISRES